SQVLKTARSLASSTNIIKKPKTILKLRDMKFHVELCLKDLLLRSLLFTNLIIFITGLTIFKYNGR
ncbi:MAG: hypothetical protein AB1485_08880, partial [Candidatus Thermoplasmatota archaeon]